MKRDLSSFLRLTAGLIYACLISTTGAMGQDLIENGGFESNPPASFGNNVGWSIAPWVIGNSDRANVVAVDGPGGGDYSNLGPESDAEGHATGVRQHYLDIANNEDMVYQSFTSLCSAKAEVVVFFSNRNDSEGRATVTLYSGVGVSGAVIESSTELQISGGSSQFDPWTQLDFAVELVQGRTYSLAIVLSDGMNMDNASVRYGHMDCEVGILKRLKNNTGQWADRIEFLIAGEHSGIDHFDGLAANRFGSFTASPAPGGNTRLIWSDPNNAIPPGGIADVGFNMPGRIVRILGVFWGSRRQRDWVRTSNLDQLAPLGDPGKWGALPERLSDLRAGLAVGRQLRGPLFWGRDSSGEPQ